MDSTTKNVFAAIGVAATAVGFLALAKRAMDSNSRKQALRRCAHLEAEVGYLKQALSHKAARVTPSRPATPQQRGTTAATASTEERKGSEAVTTASGAGGAGGSSKFNFKSEVVAIPQPLADGRREIRVYIDGCFDMMHFGHSNALRQARAVGTYLVVGLVSDDDIVINKGSVPVMPFEERYAALKACKFVDEIIINAPYDADKEYTVYLRERFGVDYIVHGDDATYNPDGSEQYEYAKSIGMYKTFKRTEGVSTTDIVGRMLLMSTEHHIRRNPTLADEVEARNRDQGLRARAMSDDLTADVTDTLRTRISNFLPTSRRIVQFSEGRAPSRTDSVVYVCGSWDLFNGGHIEFLEKAAKLGDFLLVGILDDETVNTEKGYGFPIMNLHERTLSVLQCRYVDEVIIGSPWSLTEDMINSMHISIVAHGNTEGEQAHEHSLGDPYAKARDLGILRSVECRSKLTANVMLSRVLANRERFLKRYLKKSKSESEYYSSTKTFVEES